jgi:acylphosphatase
VQTKLCMRFFISGRVQGVWFRASTQEEAVKLGLTGWAANLPDGRVEVLACGEKEKLEQLHHWLKQGPELAKIDDVQLEELAWKDYGRFAVR